MSEQQEARIRELEHAARRAVVVIAGLLDGARNYTWSTDGGAEHYLDQIDKATVQLAGVLPENQMEVKEGQR